MINVVKGIFNVKIKTKRYQVYYILFLVILISFYVITYYNCLIWYDKASDSATAMCKGKIVYLSKEGMTDWDTPTLAQWYAEDIIRSRVGPYRFWGINNIVIPIFPIFTIALLPLILITKLNKRWAWWKEIVPAVPIFAILIAVNGHVFRVLADHGFGDILFQIIVTIVEAGGVFSSMSVTAVWLFFLPGNIKRYRNELLDGDIKCKNCGYNLTGNTSGTCPECGTQINKPSKTHEK